MSRAAVGERRGLIMKLAIKEAKEHAADCKALRAAGISRDDVTDDEARAIRHQHSDVKLAPASVAAIVAKDREIAKALADAEAAAITVAVDANG